MANNNNAYFALTHPHPEPDDISVFLRHILLPSSSSSSSSNFTAIKSNEMLQHFLPNCMGISMMNYSSGNAYIPSSATNVSSSSVGTMDNDPDEYECESQGGTEELAGEASPQTQSRNSSKRSRAAEVHNLSEKRRRSRINEKMKALQNLIPNSNKTDKASMLDEAIDYLKQLQLQVQMLTMRNGFSFHPQRVVQQNQASKLRWEGNRFTHAKLGGPLHPNQDTLLNAPATETPVLTPNAFASESFINVHNLDPFQFPKGICREDWLPLHDEMPSKTGANVASTHASSPHHDTLESCLLGYQLGGAVNETNTDRDQFLAPQLHKLPYTYFDCSS